MRKLVVGLMLIVYLLVEGLSLDLAMAEPARPIRIGALTASRGPTPAIVGLRDGLLELGYRADVDFILGVRFMRGNLTDLAIAAPELVQYGVDLIFAAGSNAVKAAQAVTQQTPIVFTTVDDPVAFGLVKSYA